jgi:hypothetical protein
MDKQKIIEAMARADAEQWLHGTGASELIISSVTESNIMNMNCRRLIHKSKTLTQLSILFGRNI